MLNAAIYLRHAMSKKRLFELSLFDPENTLLSLLEKREIVFEKAPVTRDFVVAMDETIDVLVGDDRESLIENLVEIFLEWLSLKPHRKVQAQLVDGSIVYIMHDKNVNEIINILKITLKITAFDPQYNNQILNKH